MLDVFLGWESIQQFLDGWADVQLCSAVTPVAQVPVCSLYARA